LRSATSVPTSTGPGSGFPSDAAHHGPLNQECNPLLRRSRKERSSRIRSSRHASVEVCLNCGDGREEESACSVAGLCVKLMYCKLDVMR
jgi:hypothetical protein